MSAGDLGVSNGCITNSVRPSSQHVTPPTSIATSVTAPPYALPKRWSTSPHVGNGYGFNLVVSTTTRTVSSKPNLTILDSA